MPCSGTAKNASESGTGKLLYLDSSAIVKLIVSEPESAALFELVRYDPELVSSELARVEVLRALRRAEAGEAGRLRVDEVLGAIALVRIDEGVLRDAATLGPKDLGTLEAIHLATVLSIHGVGALVTYDRRLAEAGSEAGLNVAAPVNLS